MRGSHIRAAAVALLALLLVGCAQGPGHTRAAGTLAGTGAGAIIGAAASQCNRGGGAAVGALIGMMAGSMAGDGIACDQEVTACDEPVPCDPCPPGRRCDACQPQPCPRQGVVRYGPPAPPPPGYYYVGPYYAPCPPPCR